MKTLYLDELFVLNLAIDYFLLLAAAKVCALPYRRGRFSLAAALGGLWSCLAVLPALPWLGGAAIKTALALAMCLVAFGAERCLWRPFLAFLAVSVMFGGAVYAAGLRRGLTPNGGMVLRLDMRVLLLSFALCWAGVELIFRRAVRRTEREICEAELLYRGRRLRLRALRDTGNELHDPLSGCAVLVAEAEALAPLFPPEAAPKLRMDAAEAAQSVEGLRLIPYRGLGRQGGLLAAFRPQAVFLQSGERRDLVVAIAPAPLSDDGSYQAIF